ncbi:DotU/TssL family secretion system protein [Cupriavidus sp. WKF15]|uniref:DotU/TssL family secretion system protein n=1 Tax=Cupriavidus sp. WKF15 TaxID=3032282 RepID=UPI0023E1AEC1|nr:DotU/TssL family secretion system protein [Cupriavidus sp. WKF15]WER48134.1 DotU/TssL family secretion system protein [Cupriavidus sp. WKF15]
MRSSAMMLPRALRDTALTVTALADAARPAPGFETFRTRCLEQVSRLREEFSAKGQPADVVEDAAYAQCALLDEVALRWLQGTDRDAWEREPLQVAQFQSHDAGEALITRIERRLAEPQPVLPLLAVFHAVLGLGFQGRFALKGASARAALMRAIDERLGYAGVQEASGPVLVTVGKTSRWRHLSPLAWVAIACVGSGLVYVALDRWLAAAIARLAG